jgi:hypothetical protein
LKKKNNKGWEIFAAPKQSNQLFKTNLITIIDTTFQTFVEMIY